MYYAFNKRKAIDFKQIFSSVMKMTSIHTMFGLIASLDMEIEQMDIKIAFLQGDLEEEIFME